MGIESYKVLISEISLPKTQPQLHLAWFSRPVDAGVDSWYGESAGSAGAEGTPLPEPISSWEI